MKTMNLGYPRVGRKRELKKAIEQYWRGQMGVEELEVTASTLRQRHWKEQQDAGVNLIPSNDFSYYDQMLDAVLDFGAVPKRFQESGFSSDLDLYFAMARGVASSDDQSAEGTCCGGGSTTALEMTKWYDTNYHYMVPEFDRETKFTLRRNKALEEFEEAKAFGLDTMPVLIGPLTFLLLGKTVSEDDFNVLDELLNPLVDVVCEQVKALVKAGAKTIAFHEPQLVMDLPSGAEDAYRYAYEKIRYAVDSAIPEGSGTSLVLLTYFDALRDNERLAFSLPLDVIHLDLVRAPGQLDWVLTSVPDDKSISLGVVDGRNIWKNRFTDSIEVVKRVVDCLGADRVMVAPSCSLQHTPMDLELENELDDELSDWLAFAKQKLDEVRVIAAAASGDDSVEGLVAANRVSWEKRLNSESIHNSEVQARLAAIGSQDWQRETPYAERFKTQQTKLALPLYPTTTIGSLPQTADVRKARAEMRKGLLSDADYDAFLEEKTLESIRWQEEIGVDVLVHGEFERNDMVEYFGEALEGFAFSRFGWVQSYGTRCVKPPIIFGDVSRPEAMTVKWTRFAKENTDRPVKGMLTGPITILQWSFVRDDQARKDTAWQIALAIRDEVNDLEAAGIDVIQIDEPALREGLPLRETNWSVYLDWATKAFRISASGVKDSTQIHTHMCYCEFNDIIDSIAALDADVISMEASRSQMELLEGFRDFKYPNGIGPGVWDIHSPRVPDETEMVSLLEKATDLLPKEAIWVNPDCGLKTRDWSETKASMKNMVSAARKLREMHAV
ncbi:MAG: 5-methyltetrahydropteroyltriglutamate--homocysteine S-methyltransferase [Verrucomicrobia bacterium]|nr:5-methyltetrahydropteroyltriglutamate--homocysteine S-methyltransferase [Verrucomicrobiota bacterium]